VASTASIANDPLVTAYVIDPRSSAVRYHASHRLHGASGTSSSVQGKAIVHDDGNVVAIVALDGSSFRSGDADRDACVQEMLGSRGIPFAIFKGGLQLAPQTLRAACDSVAEGELMLHGVRRPLRVPLTIAFVTDGSVRVKDLRH